MKILTVCGTRPELIPLPEIFCYGEIYFKVSGIYCIKNILNNKIYIGSSNNIYNRLRDHIYRLRKTTHYNEHLQRSFLKYGENNFYFNVLEECSMDLLEEKEQFYINTLKSLSTLSGYNIAPTTNCSKLAEETKKKISEKQTGKPGHRLGFKVSDITKEKLRLINLGKSPTKETRTKISNALKGRNTWAKGSIKEPRTIEIKEKISFKNKGSGNGMAKPIVFIINDIIEERYGSIIEASIFHNIKYHTLRSCIIKNKLYNGGYFKYEK